MLSRTHVLSRTQRYEAGKAVEGRACVYVYVCTRMLVRAQFGETKLLYLFWCVIWSHNLFWREMWISFVAQFVSFAFGAQFIAMECREKEPYIVT